MTRICFFLPDRKQEKAADFHRIPGHDAPETLLSDFLSSVDADPVVSGSQDHCGPARARPGSTAENVLHVLDRGARAGRGV